MNAPVSERERPPPPAVPDDPALPEAGARVDSSGVTSSIRAAQRFFLRQQESDGHCMRY